MSENRIKILFLCRASTIDGFGHLFRCHSLIDSAPGNINLYLAILGNQNQFLTSNKLTIPEQIFTRDEETLEFVEKIEPDVVIFDLNTLEENVFLTLSKNKHTVCLSPLFEHITKVSQVFHRTKYLPEGVTGSNIYSGLDYAIPSYNCVPIEDNLYRENLKEAKLSVGISMGGGDAPNNTLKVLQALSKLDDSAMFWIFLGSGYSHSYDLLVNESQLNHRHEVVLVKTNRSMWNVLKNCHLVILSGGVTSYDAVYAGMPAINLLHSSEHAFILRELIEKHVCICPGIFSQKTLEMMPGILSDINYDRNKLWELHKNSKKLIDGKGSYRIWTRILDGLRVSIEDF